MYIHGIPKQIIWKRSDDNRYSNGKLSFLNGSYWSFQIIAFDNNYLLQQRTDIPFCFREDKFKTIEEAEEYANKKVIEFWMSITDFEFYPSKKKNLTKPKTK